MSLFSVNRNPPLREVRLFGGVWLPLALLILAGVLWRRTQLEWPAAVLACLAFLMALLAWSIPRVIRPLYVGAMYATSPVGIAVSWIVLGMTYYLVVTPFAWFMRRRGRDVLGLKFDRSATSYWVHHRPTEEKSRYFRQF